MRFTPADWQAALADLEGLLSDPASEVVKDSPSGRVLRRKLRVGPHELDVYIKAPRRKFAWKVLLEGFRPSRRSGRSRWATNCSTDASPPPCRWLTWSGESGRCCGRAC